MKTDSYDIGSYVTTHTSLFEDFLVSELKWSPDTLKAKCGGRPSLEKSADCSNTALKSMHRCKPILREKK